MSSWDKKHGYPYYQHYTGQQAFQCHRHHGPQTVHNGGNAARRAYYLEQYERIEAADSSRHQGGVLSADSISDKTYQSESKPRHGDRSLDVDAARRVYFEKMYGQTALDYPSSYKGDAARRGRAIHKEAYYKSETDEDDESEGDDDESDEEEEISRGQGGMRRYDYEAYKSEKKRAGSNHDVVHHYGDYGAYRTGARAQWRHEYLGYGVR